MLGPNAGVVLIWTTLAGELAAAALLWRGSIRSGRRLLGAAAAAAAGAVALLAWALLTNDFSVAYVADQSARGARWPYRLAGLWGGMEGSLLFWVAILAAWAVIGTAVAGRRLPAEAGPAGAVLAGVAALFALPLVAVSRPFDLLAIPALDGGGLSPVLEHPAMLYHPPLLYLGYAGTLVPFAFALAGLRSGRLGQDWMDTTRAAALGVWALLTAGIAAGAHWAYLELGWGGFWAWDPVENAALLPWLVLTAFLHAVRVDRRRRAGARASTGALALGGFLLAAFGALLTRSGAAVSVHAFAEAKAVGWFLMGTLVLLLAVSAVALSGGRRRVTPLPGSGPPRRPVGPPAPPGERLVGLGVAGLVALAAVILVGTGVPVLEGLITSSPRAVDARYFVLFCGPLAAFVIGLLLLSGHVVARRAHHRRPRLRRPGVGALAHAGILLVAVGVAGSAFGGSERVVLEAGQAAVVAGVRVAAEGFTSQRTDRGTELGVLLAVGGRDRPVRGAASVKVELHQRSATSQAQSEAAVVSTPLADVLIVPRHIDVDNGLAVIEVHRRPLMLWLWVGATLLVSAPAAGLLRRRRSPASFPGAGPASAGAPAPAPVSAPARPERPAPVAVSPHARD